MNRMMQTLIAVVVITWNTPLISQGTADHCLQIAERKQVESVYNSDEIDPMNYCSEQTKFQNNCEEPVFALFRLSNSNNPFVLNQSGSIFDEYMYPNSEFAREHKMNTVRIEHICENGYAVVYCAEFVDYPLPPADVTAEWVEAGSKEHIYRRKESDKHYEKHYEQLSQSACYSAITSDELPIDSMFKIKSSDFAPLEGYYINRPFQGDQDGRSGTFSYFEKDGILFNSLTELWEKSPRRDYSGEFILKILDY